MIPKECKPTLHRIATTPYSSQIPNYTPLGDDEAELQDLAVNPGILRRIGPACQLRSESFNFFCSS